MKKEYTGLMAEKVDFGSYNMVTEESVPPGCIKIVADLVGDVHNYYDDDTQQCVNNPDTTFYWYILDHPAGWE